MPTSEPDGPRSASGRFVPSSFATMGLVTRFVVTALFVSAALLSVAGPGSGRVPKLRSTAVALAAHAAPGPGFWHAGCPVPLSELRLLTVTHWGFDGRAHTGQLVVNRESPRRLARSSAGSTRCACRSAHMGLSDIYGWRAPPKDKTSAARSTAGRPCRRPASAAPVRAAGRTTRTACDRPQPAREPVRRVRDDARPVDPAVHGPLAASSGHGDAGGRRAPSARSAGAGAAPGPARRRTTCTSPTTATEPAI